MTGCSLQKFKKSLDAFLKKISYKPTSVMCPLCVRHVFVMCRLCVCHVSTVCPHLSDLFCLQYVRRASIVCLPCVCCMSAVCPLVVRRLSSVCPAFLTMRASNLHKKASDSHRESLTRRESLSVNLFKRIGYYCVGGLT